MSHKSSFKKYMYIPVFLAITACATGAKMSESPAANEAIADGKSRIVFYRTSILGAAIQPIVHVDGVDTARCAPNGVFTVDVVPGKHILSATTQGEHTSYVSTEAGQTTYVKCEVGFGLIYQISLREVDAVKGKSETEKLSFSGAF